ncbi:MAG: cobalamin-dependent protein [Desulfuromonadales bacterium]
MLQVLLLQLLGGDEQGALKLAQQSLHTSGDLKRFYIDVVWPAMYKIGQLWESNLISVTEEHQATAIVNQIMADMYPRFAQFTITRGKAVVSAGPNEFHEIGARMVADLLELAGWDVIYLGAQCTPSEIIEMLKRHNPFVVALSVATVFNLDKALEIVRMIKGDRETRNIKVIVGGLAFEGLPFLWEALGADGYAEDAEKATRLLDTWWSAEKG